VTCDRERLIATLGQLELKRVVERLRLRLERGTPLTGILALPDATPNERDAISRLLGRSPTRGRTASLSLEQLEAKLRNAGICADLQIAVEELTGPVSNRHAERAITDNQWNRLFAAAESQVCGRPELERWLTELRATGLLRRHDFATAETLLAQALTVLAALPVSDTPLAEFAAAALGDAHALDPGTSLGSLVLRAAAELGGCDKFNDAHSRREAWAKVGLICDELSSAVLVLNLRPTGASPTSQALHLYAQAGEPTFLTIRQLLYNQLAFVRPEVGNAVYVCENPSVIAAAANRLGPSSRPIVCLEGQPRTATRLLLNRLRAADIPLYYHGDFDWPGIQIANTVISRHAAAPWRMAASDYSAAATGPLLLAGTPIAASWDPDLMPAMQAIGKVLHEEQVTELLVADLEQEYR
jgi:uncharacterized protein (TIGR02679 family)